MMTHISRSDRSLGAAKVPIPHSGTWCVSLLKTSFWSWAHFSTRHIIKKISHKKENLCPLICFPSVSVFFFYVLRAILFQPMVMLLYAYCSRQRICCHVRQSVPSRRGDFAAGGEFCCWSSSWQLKYKSPGFRATKKTQSYTYLNMERSFSV